MECPKCKEQMKFYGLSSNPKDGDEKFTTYKCDGCDRTFIVRDPKQNPSIDVREEVPIEKNRLPKSYGKAIELFEDFNMRPVDKLLTMDISMPDSEKNPLVWLGKITHITYMSDKEGKRNQQYIHKTDPPYPEFFVTADGKTFIIAGGKMIIKDGWLYF